ncbi:MAG: hypothetical protein ACFHU9_12025 [Fluviicola sp.]
MQLLLHTELAHTPDWFLWWGIEAHKLIIPVTGVLSLLWIFYQILKIKKNAKNREVELENIVKQTTELGRLVKKMDTQTDAINKMNTLLSEQLDKVTKLAAQGSGSDGVAELARIEREKMELEHRPRVYSNDFRSSLNIGKLRVENGGKPFEITNVTLAHPTVQLRNGHSLIGKRIDENGFFEIEAITRDGAEIKDFDYFISFEVKNEIDIEYIIEFHSEDLNSFKVKTKATEA